MADQPFSPEDLLASVAAAMPPGPQTQPVQQPQPNNPVGQMQPMSQVVNPNPAQPQQAGPQGPPQPSPILANLIRGMVHPPAGGPPQTGAFGVQGPPRPASRLDVFENFLSNFLTAFGSGMSQAHGRGAFGKGFGAAVGAPYEQALQRYQVGQQANVEQAQAQNLGAEAQLRQAQAAPVQVPGIQGSIPAGSVPTIYRGYPAAQVQAGAQVQKAQIGAQNKLDVTRLQMQFAQMKAGKFLPDRDPNTGQMFYHVMNPFGQEIGQADVSAIPQLMQRMSSTVDFKQGEDGSWQALPKTTVSGPAFAKPTNATQPTNVASPSGFPQKKPMFWATQSPTGIHATPVLDKDGKPLMSKAPDNIRTMAYTAKATLPHVDELGKEMAEMQSLGVMGQFKGKMSQALAGRGFRIPGLSDGQMQAVGKFLNDVKLMDSAMLRTHFGARGGQEMYSKFSDMLNAGEDPSLMKGGLDSFRDYLTGYSQMGGMNPARQPSAPKGLSSAGAAYLKSITGQ